MKGHESIKGRNHQARQGTAKGGGSHAHSKGEGGGGPQQRGGGARGSVARPDQDQEDDPTDLSSPRTQTTNQGPQPPSRASLARHVALFAGISGRTTVGHRTWFTGRIELCCVLALCIRS